VHHPLIGLVTPLRLRLNLAWHALRVTCCIRFLLVYTRTAIGPYRLSCCGLWKKNQSCLIVLTQQIDIIYENLFLGARTTLYLPPNWCIFDSWSQIGLYFGGYSSPLQTTSLFDSSGKSKYLKISFLKVNFCLKFKSIVDFKNGIKIYFWTQNVIMFIKKSNFWFKNNQKFICRRTGFKV
jgi:hypothetical protein